jgi:hypothetical protein
MMYKIKDKTAKQQKFLVDIFVLAHWSWKLEFVYDVHRRFVFFSINSYHANGGAGTPSRGTPRGTPRLYGSMHSAAGSYTNKLGGLGASPVTTINDFS